MTYIGTIVPEGKVWVGFEERYWGRTSEGGSFRYGSLYYHNQGETIISPRNHMANDDKGRIEFIFMEGVGQPGMGLPFPNEGIFLGEGESVYFRKVDSYDLWGRWVSSCRGLRVITNHGGKL